MEHQRYLTIAQANDYFGFDKLGISVKWWYSHWRSIKGCFKVGGSIFVDCVMVEDYFKELAALKKPAALKSGTLDEKSNRHGLLL